MSAEKPGLPEQRAARIYFFIGGFGAASWAPLVPLLKARLAVDDGTLGLLLLCIGIGSLFTMPFSGAAAVRFGCRRVLTIAPIFYAALLFGLCIVSSIWFAVPLLLAFGACMGCVDVVVNIVAVLVEQAAGKRLMSGMHARWSIGGFVGAGLFGVWVGTLGMTAMQSTIIASGIILALMALFSRHLLPYGGKGGGSLIAIPHGIVIFVGIIALISFLVEGAVMDWSGVFLTTVRGWDMSLAGSGFTVFSAAMLIMRLLGDKIVQKMGQQRIVVGGAFLAFAGFLLVMLSTNPVLIFAGFFFVGLGGANVVPVFFSLLGKQDVMPVSAAVSAVSTLGYLGILAGPAAIGFISHLTNLQVAFGFLATLMFIEGLIAIYVYRQIEV